MEWEREMSAVDSEARSLVKSNFKIGVSGPTVTHGYDLGTH